MALRTLGDVLARSGPCVTISEDSSIRNLAVALAKHRVDAIVVLSSTDGTLSGIATARDVSKCIARNLNLDSTGVSHVMTPNPTTLPPTETPANALALMRRGHFRHIPIIRPDSTVIGVIDVLSLAYDAIIRLQLSYSVIPSRQGYDLLRTARENMEKPTIQPLLNRTSVTTMHRTATVSDACELIVTKHTAAVVIVDKNGVLDGIFTCTDLVKRVVAPKKDEKVTQISEVMTPNPDCASPGFTILESLQRMQACGFRHLPVVDDHSRVVVGLVDVLQLASDVLLDFNNLANASSNTTTLTLSKNTQSPQIRSGFLKWGISNFFGNLFSNAFGQRPSEDRPDFVQSTSRTVTDGFSARGTSTYSARATVAMSSSSRDVSHAKHESAVRRHYGYLASDIHGQRRHARADVPLASFKFKDINGDYRRIKVPMELRKGDFDQFMLDVRRRFIGSSGASSRLPPGAMKVKYVDEDGDSVLIANDDDLASCFEDLGEMKGKTIILQVEGMEGNNVSLSPQSPVSSTPSSTVGSPNKKSIPGFQMDEDIFKTSIQPPPTEEPIRDPSLPTGVYRTKSRPIIHTPSSLKASEGHQLMLDKRIDEAILAFTRALELDPENARAVGERGAAKLLLGASVEGEEDYRSAISLIERGKGGKEGDMTFQMCLVGLVECLLDQRRYEEAVAVAIKMDPAWGNNGCIDALRDEVENSSAAAQKALEASEFSDAMVLFSNALRVETGLLKVVEGEAHRASIRLGRAKCYKALEDYDMALEDYEAAANIEPESVAAHKGCGKCLAELEQMERALESYKKALELDGGDEEVRGAVQTISKKLKASPQSRHEEIAKLGAILNGLNFPSKHK